MATGKPCRNTFVAYISKRNSVTPIFLLHKSDQQTKIKLSEKFKKILWSGFRDTLNFQLLKVALNLLHRILLNFAESFILACWLHFRNKKWGSPGSFLRYRQLKPKYGVFLQSFLVATVTFNIAKMTEYFWAIIGVWYGTITLLLSDKVL